MPASAARLDDDQQLAPRSAPFGRRSRVHQPGERPSRVRCPALCRGRRPFHARSFAFLPLNALSSVRALYFVPLNVSCAVFPARYSRKAPGSITQARRTGRKRLRRRAQHAERQRSGILNAQQTPNVTMGVAPDDDQALNGRPHGPSTPRGAGRRVGERPRDVGVFAPRRPAGVQTVSIGDANARPRPGSVLATQGSLSRASRLSTHQGSSALL